MFKWLSVLVVMNVYCSKCNLLKELTLWNKITYVKCSNCPITNFPLWLHLDNIICYYCPIKELPPWPVVRFIICYNCENLEKIHPMPTLFSITHNHCPKLKINNEFVFDITNNETLVGDCISCNKTINVVKCNLLFVLIVLMIGT